MEASRNFCVPLKIGMGIVGTLPNNSVIYKESNDARFVALLCIVFELPASEKSGEFPAESCCKANDQTRRLGLFCLTPAA